MTDNEDRQCSAGFVKLRDVAAWEECSLRMRITEQALSSSGWLQPGRNSDNEGRLCRAGFVKLRAAAAWEELCLAVRVDNTVQAL